MTKVTSTPRPRPSPHSLGEEQSFEPFVFVYFLASHPHENSFRAA